MPLSVSISGLSTTSIIDTYTVYKYTNSDTPSSVTFTGSGYIDILVVGGGANSFQTKLPASQRDPPTQIFGGGAGGFIEILNFPISAGEYSITVGKGGENSPGTSSNFIGNGIGIGAGGGGGSTTSRSSSAYNGKHYNDTSTSITHGCGGSGAYIHSGTYIGHKKGNSKVTDLSNVTYGCNDGLNSNGTSASAGAGPNGAGIKSVIIDEVCSAASNQSNGSYGSNGHWSHGNAPWENSGRPGIVAFRISSYQPPTIGPTIGPTIAATIAATIAPTIAPTIGPIRVSTLSNTAPTIAHTIAPTISPTINNTTISVGDTTTMAPTKYTPPSNSWLPYPVDETHCQLCEDPNLNELIKEQIAPDNTSSLFESYYKSQNQSMQSSSQQSLFNILNQTITFKDASDNIFTYKAFTKPPSNKMTYSNNQIEIPLDNDLVWTRQLKTAITKPDHQKTTNSQGNIVQYDFNYTTIDNSKNNILVYYDCRTAHTGYKKPNIIKDDIKGHYTIEFASTATDILERQAHIHVAEYTDQDYDSFRRDGTGIMDFFVRTYPKIVMNINNLPKLNKTNNLINSSQFNFSLTQQVLSSFDIINLIGEYYKTLCKNREKINEYQSIISTNIASDTLYQDNVEAYNKTYLNVVNISAGILVAIGCIYSILTISPNK